MVTFRPRKEIIKVVNRSDDKEYKSGLGLLSFYPYLLSKKIDLVTYCNLEQQPLYNIRDTELSIKIDRNKPAFVIVKSIDKSHSHIVLWDGKVVRDPAPSDRDEDDLNTYGIMQWIPIHFITKKKKERFYGYYH